MAEYKPRDTSQDKDRTELHRRFEERWREDIQPRPNYALGVLFLILLIVFAATCVGVAKASAAETDYRMRVHAERGHWAYKDPNHARSIVAPRGTNAAHKMRVAYPGDLFTYTDAMSGTFQVTAVIDITKSRAWDKVMHIRGTDFYVYLDRFEPVVN